MSAAASVGTVVPTVVAVVSEELFAEFFSGEDAERLQAVAAGLGGSFVRVDRLSDAELAEARIVITSWGVGPFDAAVLASLPKLELIAHHRRHDQALRDGCAVRSRCRRDPGGCGHGAARRRGVVDVHARAAAPGARDAQRPARRRWLVRRGCRGRAARDPRHSHRGDRRLTHRTGVSRTDPCARGRAAAGGPDSRCGRRGGARGRVGHPRRGAAARADRRRARADSARDASPDRPPRARTPARRRGTREHGTLVAGRRVCVDRRSAERSTERRDRRVRRGAVRRGQSVPLVAGVLVTPHRAAGTSQDAGVRGGPSSTRSKPSRRGAPSLTPSPATSCLRWHDRAGGMRGPPRGHRERGDDPCRPRHGSAGARRAVGDAFMPPLAPDQWLVDDERLAHTRVAEDDEGLCGSIYGLPKRLRESDGGLAAVHAIGSVAVAERRGGRGSHAGWSPRLCRRRATPTGRCCSPAPRRCTAPAGSRRSRWRGPWPGPGALRRPPPSGPRARRARIRRARESPRSARGLRTFTVRSGPGAGAR